METEDYTSLPWFRLGDKRLEQLHRESSEEFVVSHPAFGKPIYGRRYTWANHGFKYRVVYEWGYIVQRIEYGQLIPRTIAEVIC